MCNGGRPDSVRHYLVAELEPWDQAALGALAGSLRAPTEFLLGAGRGGFRLPLGRSQKQEPKVKGVNPTFVSASPRKELGAGEAGIKLRPPLSSKPPWHSSFSFEPLQWGVTPPHTCGSAAEEQMVLAGGREASLALGPCCPQLCGRKRQGMGFCFPTSH